jgi:hypothetical protein
MASRKGGVLWVAALIVALIAAAAQIAVLVMLWSRFDPRLSCDRMIHWGEWLACMQPHEQIFFSELAVAAWTIAVIVGTLGRFLPTYISFIFPAGIAILLVLFLIRFWLEWSRSHTTSFSDVLYFISNAGLFLLFALSPSVSAWLLAFHKRKDRAQPQLSTVFE